MLVVLLLAAVPASIAAQTVIDSVYGPPAIYAIVKLTIGTNATTVNGAARVLDVAPFVNPETNRTMVPIRFITESLGASVRWDAAARQVIIRLERTEVILTIGSNIAIVNGKEVKLDSPAEIVSNRTFVPVRFVAEALGAVVNYDHETKEITIKSSFKL